MTYDSSLSGSRLRISRSRGAVPGLILILLGAWGILIPLIGGYFNFGFAPNDTWNLTEARWWFEVLPGVVVVVGGLLLLIGSDRITTSLGGWLAALGGVWFVTGTTVQPILVLDALGVPLHNSDVGAMAERLMLTNGLGIVIVFISAWALGALAVVGVRDVRAAARHRTVPVRDTDVDIREKDVDAPRLTADRRASTESPTSVDTVP